jgi:hypothetical protein
MPAYTHALAGKVLTRQQAIAARAELMSDREFYEAWALKNDPAAAAFLAQLARQATGNGEFPLDETGGWTRSASGIAIKPSGEESQ